MTKPWLKPENSLLSDAFIVFFPKKNTSPSCVIEARKGGVVKLIGSNLYLLQEADGAIDEFGKRFAFELSGSEEGDVGELVQAFVFAGERIDGFLDGFFYFFVFFIFKKVYYF